MTTARGFSLVEILASAVLLTLIAAASVPLLMDAETARAQRVHEAVSGGDIHALARFADAFIEDIDPEELDQLSQMPLVTSLLLEEEHVAVTIRVERSEQFRWMVFETDQHGISRWLDPRLLPDPEATEP